MKKKSLIILAVLVTLYIPKIANAQGSLQGYMFADYYSVLENNNTDLNNQHGFWFRRIYFTYNNQLTDSIKMRLRFEMASEDFGSDKLYAFVKDAYLSAKLAGQSLNVGIMSTPTFGHTVEDVWGLRHLEKTPLDLFKFASSRDFGIGLKGSLDQGKMVNYSIMYGNGSSNKGEANAGKKFYGAVAFKPAESLTLEIYGDYEHRSKEDKRYTYQGFASYQGDWGRIGVLYANQVLDNASTYNLGLASVFAVFKASEKIELIARVDTATTSDWKEKFKGSGIGYIPFTNYSKPTLFIAGFSIEAAKNIWILPNVKYITYAGDEFKNDVYANITLFFKFK